MRKEVLTPRLSIEVLGESFRGSLASPLCVRRTHTHTHTNTHTMDHTLLECAILSSACNYRLQPAKYNFQGSKKKKRTFFRFWLLWRRSHLLTAHFFQCKVAHNPLILHSVVKLTSHFSPVKTKRATCLKHHPLNQAVIPECNRIWDTKHEDLTNPLLRTSVILLKIPCIHTG